MTKANPQPARALEGVKVLDLSRVLAGPWATQMLADFGADVIKVELPGKGDDTRGWGPPFLKLSDGSDDPQESAYYLCCNRNKRSIAIDMTKPEGQALIRDLARDADIVVENFKVGGLKKYGLDYDSVVSSNPRLVILDNVDPSFVASALASMQPVECSILSQRLIRQRAVTTLTSP